MLSQGPCHIATLKCLEETLRCCNAEKDPLSAFLSSSSTFSYSSSSPDTSVQPFFLQWTLSGLSFSNFSILWRKRREVKGVYYITDRWRHTDINSSQRSRIELMCFSGSVIGYINTAQIRNVPFFSVLDKTKHLIILCNPIH